jgi:hypothetical protein
MIKPLLNMTIKGAIWYQGEANQGDPFTEVDPQGLPMVSFSCDGAKSTNSLLFVSLPHALFAFFKWRACYDCLTLSSLSSNGELATRGSFTSKWHSLFVGASFFLVIFSLRDFSSLSLLALLAAFTFFPCHLPFQVSYGCRFPQMIADWRAKWHEGTMGETDAVFPFGFVQLAPWIQSSNGPGGVRWGQTAG